MEWLKRLIGREAGSSGPAGDMPGPPPAPVHTRYAFDDRSVRIAAIGDLHGRIDLLKQVAARLDELARDPSKRLVEVYLGDYIDRGGDARATLTFLAERSKLTDREVVCLAGNHEHMLLAAIESDRDFLSWLGLGGKSTLVSYGVSPAQAKAKPLETRMAFRAVFPPAHMAFLGKLDLFHRRGGFFFVHAGVRPGKPLDQQDPSDLLWIRESFMTSNVNFGEVVVHGHTPVDRPQFRHNRISIDTGAYYSGKLTCVVITSENVSVLDVGHPSVAVP